MRKRLFALLLMWLLWLVKPMPLAIFEHVLVIC